MGIKLLRGFWENFFIWRSCFGGRVLDSYDFEGILGDGGGFRNVIVFIYLVFGVFVEDDDVEVEGFLLEFLVLCLLCLCI